MSRKKIVAGNWKMNQNLFEGKQLVTDILKRTAALALPENLEVLIAPPFTQLELAATQLKDVPGHFLAAQNCHQEASGAYTGEISAGMLKSVAVAYVILGHSERRQYFGEDEALLAKKTDAALSQGLKVIFCVGEPLEIRDAGTQNDLVRRQIEGGLFHLSADQWGHIVIAYEPVWAIGTGRTATAAQAQDMHAFIRSLLAEQYGAELADATTILYGGSAKPSNAPELFACPDVDGGLIGGASLNADDFEGIVKAAL
ncbi:triose-phosphate isomerase [Taibaiella koreensis]|uniref:triose-phosphate isomerase n=1 Tax=Taibaiella koreensis TaxID=1268548 RepID=UPI000E59D150|nr:triose-phosphate isomerase [Taibaiella koreensis]